MSFVSPTMLNCRGQLVYNNFSFDQCHHLVPEEEEEVGRLFNCQHKLSNKHPLTKEKICSFRNEHQNSQFIGKELLLAKEDDGESGGKVWVLMTNPRILILSQHKGGHKVLIPPSKFGKEAQVALSANTHNFFLGKLYVNLDWPSKGA